MRDDEKVDPAELLLEAQQELAALQRQYRCLRNDKKSYTEECEHVIRRQVDTIESLETENTDLVTLLNVAGSLYNQCFDKNNLEGINALMEREKQIEMEMESERDSIVEVDSQFLAMENKINQQRKLMRGSKDVAHHKYIIVQKHIRVLQNRLDNLSKKFNDAMTENRKLRSNIGNVLRQKARYRYLDNKLQQKLDEGKAHILKISEVATAHFNARDEAQHRMASLRERSERDMTLYNLEIKDVMRVIDHDIKLREFMNTKTVDRVSVLLEELKSRELQKLTVQLSGLKKEVSKFEDIFDKIKEATGIYNTHELVQSFIGNEDKNFALYNYVNAMGRELESLNNDIKYLKDEIEITKKEGVENDYRRKEILRDLESKFLVVSTRNKETSRQYKAEKRIVELLKPRTEKLFNVLKCDRGVISEMLGGGVTISDYNITLYLGIMEQKCNQLLMLSALHKIKNAPEDQRDAMWEGLFGLGPLPAHTQLSITTPRIEEEGDYVTQIRQFDSKPMNIEEIQALVSQGGISRGGPSSKGKQAKKTLN